MGQADNRSIEIKLNYTNGPGPVFRVFQISDEVRPIFESLSLCDYNKIDSRQKSSITNLILLGSLYIDRKNKIIV